LYLIGDFLALLSSNCPKS